MRQIPDSEWMSSGRMDVLLINVSSSSSFWATTFKTSSIETLVYRLAILKLASISSSSVSMSSMKAPEFLTDLSSYPQTWRDVQPLWLDSMWGIQYWKILVEEGCLLYELWEVHRSGVGSSSWE